MNLGRIIVSLLKGKALALIGASVVLTGGVTAVMAATPMGQHLIQTVITTQKATPTATNRKDDQNGSSHEHTTSRKDEQDGSSHENAKDTDHTNPCPGLPDAQRLAANFSLNSAAESDDIGAICSLHTGTFKGTTPSGQAVLSGQVLGYGQIDQLLTSAQNLASHDKANTAGKLTSGNVRAYLAAVLQSCGTTPLAACINGHLPSSQSDPTASSTKAATSDSTSHTNDNGTSADNHSSDNKNTGGKSTSTSTPHS